MSVSQSYSYIFKISKNFPKIPAYMMLFYIILPNLLYFFIDVPILSKYFIFICCKSIFRLFIEK